MQLHQLKPRTKKKKFPRVGRGGKRGKTSGRGTKGQKARAGRKMRPEMRDIIKKVPKARGYRFKSTVEKPAVFNIGDLADFTGTAVNPNTLVLARLVRRRSGKIPKVKILGTGDVTRAFTVTRCLVSATAKAAIEKAGGTIAA